MGIKIKQAANVANSKFWYHIVEAMRLYPKAVEENNEVSKKIGRELEPITTHLKTLNNVFKDMIKKEENL